MSKLDVKYAECIRKGNETPRELPAMNIHPPELIDELRKYDSATVSNAIEHFQVRDRAAGFANLDLKCQFPDYEPMIGYAVTCTADTVSPGESRPSQMDHVWDLVHESAKPAVLVVQYVGSDPKKSCFFGDMSATGLHRLGATGIKRELPAAHQGFTCFLPAGLFHMAAERFLISTST